MASFRKRFLVSEGDLFQLYKEIEQVRNQEQRDVFYNKFRILLKEAQSVKLVVTPKTKQNEYRAKK